MNIKLNLEPQPYDKGFKNLIKENPTGFLKMIQLNEKVEQELGTNITIDKSQLHMDYAFKSESQKLFDLEFESYTPTKKDIDRYYKYAAGYSKENNGECVDTNIILGKYATKPNFKNYPYCKFQLPLNFISLNKYDGDKILNNIINKNSSEITDEDRAKLSCIAMFHTNMDYNEYLLKAAKFTKDLKINKKDLELIMNTQLLFSQMTDEKTQIKLRRYLKCI